MQKSFEVLSWRHSLRTFRRCWDCDPYGAHLQHRRVISRPSILFVHPSPILQRHSMLPCGSKYQICCQSKQKYPVRSLLVGKHNIVPITTSEEKFGSTAPLIKSNDWGSCAGGVYAFFVWNGQHLSFFGFSLAFWKSCGNRNVFCTDFPLFLQKAEKQILERKCSVWWSMNHSWCTAPCAMKKATTGVHSIS